MRTVITMSLYDRPDYTRQVVDHLLACKGLTSDKYHIVVKVDPSPVKDRICLQAMRLSHKVDTEVIVNPMRLGCNRNIYECLSRGFETDERLIHIEDDVLVAPDFFDWAEFCFDEFHADREVFSWAGYSRDVREKPTLEGSLLARYRHLNHFVCWGWGTWIDRWWRYNATWPKNEFPDGRRTAWDTCISRDLALRGHKIVVPSISRTKNIGACNGTYNPDVTWHEENVKLDYWSGDATAPRHGWYDEDR